MARTAVDGVKRDHTLRVCVTPDQHAAFSEAARRKGLDLSTWLRQLGIEASGWQPSVVPLTLPPVLDLSPPHTPTLTERGARRKR